MASNDRTDLLARTAALVDVASPSRAEGPLVDSIEAELRAHSHLEVTRVGDNLVARTSLGRLHRVVLAGHTDTVPSADPFCNSFKIGKATLVFFTFSKPACASLSNNIDEGNGASFFIATCFSFRVSIFYYLLVIFVWLPANVLNRSEGISCPDSIR